MVARPVPPEAPVAMPKRHRVFDCSIRTTGCEGWIEMDKIEIAALKRNRVWRPIE